MSERTFILISCEPSFAERFSSLINNVNAVNNGVEPKVLIEKVYVKSKPKYAAIPKKSGDDL